MATVKGTPGNDQIFAGLDFEGLEDVVLGLDGADEIDGGFGAGGNTLGGGEGADLIFAGTNDQVLGDGGADELDASDGGGDNALWGGAGNDAIFAGTNDRVFGGAGDDEIYAGTGNNRIWGGSGQDQFWLAAAEAPESVNIIEDFDPQADQLLVVLTEVNDLEALSFIAQGQDTLIKVEATGEELALVKNTAPTSFGPGNVGLSQNAAENSAGLRVASFNASLNRSVEGQLIADLSTPDNAQAKTIAEIIQRNNPDIVLLNEFDFDDQGAGGGSLAAELFAQNYLAIGQNGAAAVEYPYVYVAPSNTGIQSGLDLDNDGVIGGPGDTFAFGAYEGQFAMILLSKYPILTEEVRTFQNFLWQDMPGNLLTNDPTEGENNLANFYSPEAVEILRLSSKSHWDVPVSVNGEIIHILAAHPTPPVFDGAEDRNGKRNFDEIRFWSDYVTPGKGAYLYDDQGQAGGLQPGAQFVIVGDHNADPFDGDSYTNPEGIDAADQFFLTPVIQGSPTDASLTPTSAGGPDAAERQGGLNAASEGNPAFDTADFGPDTVVPNLRVDYALPSYNTTITGAGVFWPADEDPLFDLVGDFPFPSSDHRLVYVDLALGNGGTVNQDRVTVQDVELLGLTTFATGTEFNGTQVGGLSGVAYDSNLGQYYAISDDRSQINPARFYTLDIDLTDGALEDGDVSFTGVTTLTDGEGNPFPLNGSDFEGVALTENGSVYIPSEGVASTATLPLLGEFSLSGQQLAALALPPKFIPNLEATQGVRPNLAFESAAITPDGRYFYTAVENALAQDGTIATLEDTSLSRILKYDLTTGAVVAEYVYEVDAIPQGSNPPGGFADNGLVELIALDNNGTLLALERSFAAGVGNTVKLYQVLTQGALQVQDFDDLFREEPLDDDGEIIPPGRFAIDPTVSKTLLLDFADLGIAPDNLEGMTLGPVLEDGRQSLIVVSDNNFNASQSTQFIALALELETRPAVLPVVETPDTVDDEDFFADQTQPLNILLVNDDGYDAEGIRVLYEALVDAGHTVTLVGPKEQQSGRGTAIDTDKIFQVLEVVENPDGNSETNDWYVDGTPVTTTLTGLNFILEQAPDLVISGINAGENLGLGAVSSGTLSAAVTAVQQGIPAIAVSAGLEADFSVAPETYAIAANYVVSLIGQLQRENGADPLPAGLGLNVNIPAGGLVQGVSVTQFDGAASFDLPIIDTGAGPLLGFAPNSLGAGVAPGRTSEGEQFLADAIPVTPFDGDWSADPEDRQAISERLQGLTIPALDAPVAPTAEPLTILLVNDDGYQADGIAILREILLEAGHQVILVAPKEQQSGQGTSLDVDKLGQVIETVEFDADQWYVDGRPVTTTLVGLDYVLAQEGITNLDLVVSGINEGENIGLGAVSSGTLSAAVAALQTTVPAIAVSAGIDFAEIQQGNLASTERAYEVGARFVAQLIDQLSATKGEATAPILPVGVGLNVNIPALAEGQAPAGLAVTKFDETASINFIVQDNGSGEAVFTLGAPVITGDPESEGGNFLEDFLTITPFDGDWTAQAALAEVSEDLSQALIGDSDDPAVWIDPLDAANSLVIATLKDGGLVTFNLDGSVSQNLAALPNGEVRYNNVDVLYNVSLNGETVDIAIASDRENDALGVFKIDPASRQLVNIAADSLSAEAFSIFGVDDGEATAYGLAAYRSPVTGKSFVFVTQASGNQIAQLELVDNGAGLISAQVVRTIELPIADGNEAEDYQSEAIVVDQEKGIVYLAVEGEIGIVKFGAEPNSGDQITVVRPVDSPELVPDLEGLGLYYGPNGTGYLIASSQGDSCYALYTRDGSNAYLASFVIGDNEALGIDQANETDGLDVINVPLGPLFPFGALLVQDGANDPQNVVENDDELENNATNFKFVRWEDVAGAFEQPLIIDTESYDPRNSAANPQSLVNGVASGDVDQDSAVVWARSLFPGEITFEYGADADLTTVLGAATANVTDASLPVKVELEGLTPNTEYFYRVTDAAGASLTGRFQTAAAPGTQGGLTFGVTGDWRGELAPYLAVSNVAEQNLDFFVSHGDTIYADYGSDAVLNPDGSRKEQVETLEEYRAKHAEVYGPRLGANYLADIRRSTSILATIDDHEVIDNFAGGELAASDDRFPETEGLINDTQLYENGLQAFQEYNPLEDRFYEDNTGDERFDGERQLYRYQTYGSDAAVMVVDTRSFRDEALPEPDFADPAQVQQTLLASLTLDRTLLGSLQLQDLKDDLLAAQAQGVTWKFVMIPEPIQNILPGITVDSYEGYGKERNELLQFIEANQIDNVVFVAADVHSTYVNNLTYQNLTATGIEQVAVPVWEITTGAVAFDPPTGEILAGIVTANNPALADFYNSLPIAPDPTDSEIPDDKDDFVEQAINAQALAPGGFDFLGLDNNLPSAEGLIDATLLQGDYYVGHTFGWSQFEIDPVTQALTVTTYGLNAYSEAEILAGDLDSLTPRIVSQFVVNPQGEEEPVLPIELNPVGTYATGLFDEGAAEIPAYDPGSQRLFVVNAGGSQVDVFDLSDPANPALIASINTSAFGSPNSVAVKNGTLAIAVENDDKQANGEVWLFRAGAPLENLVNPRARVEVGALPDMLAFSPNGQTILVANEGEPNDDYTVDPEGSVSVIDVSQGLNNVTVQTAGFGAFNDQVAALREAGVKLKGDVGTDRTVAQDLEPEYVAFSPDGAVAWVTLQEANAVAVVDVATATVMDVKPLGFKDYSAEIPGSLETFTFSDLPSIGTTPAGQELFLGGFSGLFYTGAAANGNLQFVTHTDRGPNGEPTDDGRPFLLPDFAPEIIRFELNQETGELLITERIGLTQADGTPLTGLPNINLEGAASSTPFNDEIPVDLSGDPIALDNFGADLEGIVVAADGSFWMVDEYRPAIYQFDSEGQLLQRFVPEGTAAAAEQPEGTFGTEVLPSVLAQRRQNRGFEAAALDGENQKLYAFIQSPLRNPVTVGNTELNGLNNVRIVEFDLVTQTVTGEYLYRLDNPNLGTPGNTRPDKIGDAVYIGNGEFLVVERDDDAVDSDPLSNIEKWVYRFSLDGATNLLADIPGKDGLFDLGGGVSKSLDQMTEAELTQVGANPIAKTLASDLVLAGYNAVEKVEGLAWVDGSLALLNDNDFQVAGIDLNGDGTFTPDPNPEPIVLGLLPLQPNQLDASDKDGVINIQSWPVFGLFQPDSIGAYTFNGETFYVTANEGDARDYDGYSEVERIKDVSLDPVAFPNAEELQSDEQIGRLSITTELGDADGDGDFDQLYSYGGRSFSIWNSAGNLVFDSGDAFEQLTAQIYPDFFNASNSNNDFDNRSDDKGPEPEGLVLGAINGRTYAFIGLERIGGVMVYDISNPTSPDFIQYLNNRDFSADVETPEAGDLGPEGLTFISAGDSPNGVPLLVVANEISGTTTVYEIAVNTANLILGDAQDNRLIGTEAADDIQGLGGNDRLNGQGGNDTLLGGNGDDFLIGGLGDDNLDGGAGFDTLEAQGDVDFLATDTTLTGLGTDTFANIEFIRLAAGAGDNILDASAVASLWVRLDGQGGDDLLTGGKLNDVLLGGAGADTLTGGMGDDTLRLGANDGAGDTVNYRLGDGRDTALDFSRTGVFDILNFIDLETVEVRNQLAQNRAQFRSQGELLLTVQGVTDFSAADVGSVLLGANFTFA